VAGAPGLLSCGGPLARGARPGQGFRAEIGAARGTTDAGERRLRYLCHCGLLASALPARRQRHISDAIVLHMVSSHPVSHAMIRWS
jgi:hypothetical protein